MGCYWLPADSNKALSASELSAMVIERGREAGRVGTGFVSAEDTLAKLDLIAIDGSLKNADYAIRTAVEVNVYMDTVQIVSPGLFPDGDSPERHLDGVASEFSLRNPDIARTLFRAGVIEQYGTGIPRIKEACEATGVKFHFEQTANSTVVVFERPGPQAAVAESELDHEAKTMGITADIAWNALLGKLGKTSARPWS